MTTALNVSQLSKAELLAELKTLSNQHRNETSLKQAVAERLPGICISVAYCGPMFMGMAMSHYHTGPLSF
jgi:hypothetical protein